MLGLLLNPPVVISDQFSLSKTAVAVVFVLANGDDVIVAVSSSSMPHISESISPFTAAKYT